MVLGKLCLWVVDGSLEVMVRKKWLVRLVGIRFYGVLFVRLKEFRFYCYGKLIEGFLVGGSFDYWCSMDVE